MIKILISGSNGIIGHELINVLKKILCSSNRQSNYRFSKFKVKIL